MQVVDVKDFFEPTEFHCVSTHFGGGAQCYNAVHISILGSKARIFPSYLHGTDSVVELVAAFGAFPDSGRLGDIKVLAQFPVVSFTFRLEHFLPCLTKKLPMCDQILAAVKTAILSREARLERYLQEYSWPQRELAKRLALRVLEASPAHKNLLEQFTFNGDPFAGIALALATNAEVGNQCGGFIAGRSGPKTHWVNDTLSCPQQALKDNRGDVLRLVRALRQHWKHNANQN